MPLRGSKAHVARLKRLTGGSLERDVGAALFAGGERIQVAAQISITEGATDAKGEHVPSRPGEPPNNEKGTLANNIETVQKGPLLVEVSSNAAHSTPLELGTSRMSARPFMAPARDAERGNVEKLVADAVKRASKRR